MERSTKERVFGTVLLHVWLEYFKYPTEHRLIYLSNKLLTKYKFKSSNYAIIYTHQIPPYLDFANHRAKQQQKYEAKMILKTRHKFVWFHKVCIKYKYNSKKGSNIIKVLLSIQEQISPLKCEKPFSINCMQLGEVYANKLY